MVAVREQARELPACIMAEVCFVGEFAPARLYKRESRHALRLRWQMLQDSLSIGSGFSD